MRQLRLQLPLWHWRCPTAELARAIKAGQRVGVKWQRHATLLQALASFRPLADFCTSVRPSCCVRLNISSQHETISEPPPPPILRMHVLALR